MAFIALLIAIAVPIAKTSWQVNRYYYDDNENQTGYFTSLGKRLKLRAYTDTQYGYVYAQTDRDLLNLVQEIERVKPSSIHIASPDYWPLPWYLRNSQIAGYSQEVPENFTGPALIAAANQQEEAAKKLPGYRQQEFVLRPGVNLLLFVKET
jgi:predicted membrane-bound mannosyltransferase